MGCPTAKPRCNPWYGPCCTMVHAAETSPHLLHTTGCMRPTGSVPWCTPWGMPWSSWHFSHGSTHDILLSKQTHGPFHSLSDGRPMTYLPWKTFYGTTPSMDDRWVALRLNHGVCHACVVGHFHARFSGIHSLSVYSTGEPMGYPMSTRYTPWYIYDLICRGVYNWSYRVLHCTLLRVSPREGVCPSVYHITRLTGQLVPWLTKPTD